MVSPVYAVVTGGTRGIGLEVSRGLIRQGIHVIIVGSDSSHGASAMRSLCGDAISQDQVMFLAADLSHLRLLPELADRITNLVPHLDILIHNAGVITAHHEMTDDGIERQLAVNHLAVYGLTRELMPLLMRAPAARIVVTSSIVERNGAIDFPNLMGELDYSPLNAYCQSKLANVLFTYELARRLRGTSITANCLHPGAVRTKLLDTYESARREPGSHWSPRRTIGRLLRVLRLLPPVRDWALSPIDGARTVIWAATAPEVAAISGRFFQDCEVADSSPQSHDEATQSRLWIESAALLGTSARWPQNPT